MSISSCRSSRRTTWVFRPSLIWNKRIDRRKDIVLCRTRLQMIWSHAVYGSGQDIRFCWLAVPAVHDPTSPENHVCWLRKSIWQCYCIQKWNTTLIQSSLLKSFENHSLGIVEQPLVRILPTSPPEDCEVTRQSGITVIAPCLIKLRVNLEDITQVCCKCKL